MTKLTHENQLQQPVFEGTDASSPLHVIKRSHEKDREIGSIYFTSLRLYVFNNFV